MIWQGKLSDFRLVAFKLTSPLITFGSYCTNFKEIKAMSTLEIIKDKLKEKGALQEVSSCSTGEIEPADK